MIEDSLDLSKQEWRPVVGYEFYYDVSNLGEVRRIEGRTAGRIIRQSKTWRGYCKLDLFNGKVRTVYVHYLVAGAFIGPRPEGAHINHMDGNKENNVAWNLEYVTPSQNIRHAISTGLKKTKLTVAQVAEIKSYPAAVEPWMLAPKYNVSVRQIAAIRKGEAWGYIDPKCIANGHEGRSA